ncbi:hypothetical protein H4R34_005829, partial [Dimargaris verticillata]
LVLHLLILSVVGSATTYYSSRQAQRSEWCQQRFQRPTAFGIAAQSTPPLSSAQPRFPLRFFQRWTQLWLWVTVWSSLYLLVGVAALLVAHEAQVDASKFIRDRAHISLRLTWFAWVLGLLWSPILVAFRAIATALIDAALHWVFVGLAILCTLQVHSTAAVLLVPYWLGASYTLYISYTLWITYCQQKLQAPGYEYAPNTSPTEFNGHGDDENEMV